jgi:hypothetical protein
MAIAPFGATCNGTGDDTAAINRALARCGGACKAVLIPRGTCIISSPLKVPSSCSLGGAGIDLTIVRKKAGSTFLRIGGLIENANPLRGNNDIVIHDLTLQGEGTSQTPNGIYLSSVHGGEVHDLHLKDILNGDDAAIEIDSSSHFAVRRCTIRNSTNNGIRISSNVAPSSDFTVEGNDVADIAHADGIFVAMTGRPAKHAASNFAVVRNVVRNVNDTGIEVGGGGDGVAQHQSWRVVDNKVYDSPTGILIRNAIHGVVERNLVSGCARGKFTGAITVYAGEADVTDVKIVDNTIEDYRDTSGIVIALQPKYRPSNLTITGNHVSAGPNGQSAIRFDGYCEKTEVKNNFITIHSGRSAVELDNRLGGGPVECSIAGNSVTVH